MLTPSPTLPWTIDLDEAGSDELIDPTSLQAEPESRPWDGEAWLQSISDQEEALRWSDRAAQVEWEERIEQQGDLTLSHTCTSCHYFHRDYHPAVVCALHPAGMSVAVHEPHTCRDWQALDLIPELAALEQALAQHSTTCGKDWMILRLVYPPELWLRALVQVEGQGHQWHWWDTEQWRYGGKYWQNLGEWERFRVWCNPKLSVMPEPGDESSGRQPL